MSIREKTLISMSKMEEVSRFMVALQKAKQNTDGARAYARLNPVCSGCQKSGDVCLKLDDGIRCVRCRVMKRGCPRVVDFWIRDVARRLGRSEGYVQGLYSVHGTMKRPGAAAGSSPSRASGSNNSHSKSAVGARPETIVVVEGSEAEEEDYNFESDEDGVQSKRKASTSTRGPNRLESGITHGASKNVLDPQRKENELLKLRAETAENNFIALVGRVQDFRTSLRSEIRTMPNAVDSDGLSKLSAAMETTIDDAGLYLRTISDTLNQSRTNWGINYGTRPEVDKAKEAGSKEPRPSTSARQIRQRSPEVADGNTMQKRRKI